MKLAHDQYATYYREGLKSSATNTWLSRYLEGGAKRLYILNSVLMSFATFKILCFLPLLTWIMCYCCHGWDVTGPSQAPVFEHFTNLQTFERWCLAEGNGDRP